MQANDSKMPSSANLVNKNLLADNYSQSFSSEFPLTHASDYFEHNSDYVGLDEATKTLKKANVIVLEDFVPSTNLEFRKIIFHLRGVKAVNLAQGLQVVIEYNPDEASQPFKRRLTRLLKNRAMQVTSTGTAIGWNVLSTRLFLYRRLKE